MLVIPGPNAFVVLRSSLERSILSPIMAAVGVASGAGIAAVVAAWGASVLPPGPGLRTLSSVVVALILLRAALRLSTVPPDREGPGESARPGSFGEPFVVGLVTAMMNPLSVPFFAAFFVSHACTGWVMALVCCAVFAAAGTWFVSLGVAASRFRRVPLSPPRARTATLAVAAALVAMATRYLWLAASS